MISSTSAELDPDLAAAVSATVSAFRAADSPVTVARVPLPIPDIAALRLDGRWLLLVDDRVPDERLAAAVQDVELRVPLEGLPGWMSVDLTPAHHPGQPAPSR